MTATTPTDQTTPGPEEPRKGITRRTVIGTAAGVAGVAAVGGMFHEGFRDPFTQATAHGTGDAADAYDPTDLVHTMCMQCNSFCTIKVRLEEAPEGSPATALIRKIAGNPYSALTTQPVGPIPYDTPLADAAQGIGTM
ncbi:MAG TPA: hypothetical protein GXZ45_11710, partial [Propionibacterium sp.]|nr:hypothetical protein [Propionibacterium sp.]